MSALYDEVAALDKGVADRWKARTQDNPGHKLTPGDVDAIISPLLKTKKGPPKITKTQAEAIVTFVRATDFAEGGLDRLRFWVRFAEDSIALDLRPLIADDELSPINNALAIASHISFTSPGTKITYAPHDYMAIAQLVKQRKIMVFQAEMSDLSMFTKNDGEYRSDFNMLIIYRKLDSDAFTATVVHEATHAIRDWRDVRTRTHFNEADAYIAANTTLDEPFDGALQTAAFRASRFVIERKAQPGNKDWQKAYENVVKAYDATHSDGTNLVSDTDIGESDQYKAILDAIDKAAQEFEHWAVDELDRAVRDMSGALKEVIP
ncbi:MAG: hypothetical protein ABSF15_27955 [Candidatus Sulfotelmatobacter sp.]|jgi:hypothetical protein